MKEFIEKLVTRLEKDNRIGRKSFEAIVENINELAEEYKDKLDDEWQIIYNKILNLEKKYANDGNTESVNDCIKLENLLQYFKEELQVEPLSAPYKEGRE